MVVGNLLSSLLQKMGKTLVAKGDIRGWAYAKVLITLSESLTSVSIGYLPKSQADR